MKICPIQDLCQDYSNGTKRKSHHLRITEPCKSFLDMSCEMSIKIQLFLGEELACDINKIRRIKGELK